MGLSRGLAACGVTEEWTTQDLMNAVETDHQGLGLLSLPRPLDLHDPLQQLPAFVDTAALIGGGTAAWLALTLLLRAPTPRRTRSAERVP